MNEQNNKITLFVLISVLIHLVFFFFLRDGLNHLAQVAPPKPIWLDLKNVQLPQQIADIPKPAHEEVPDKASAQALYNQKVSVETVNPMPPSPAQGTGGTGVTSRPTVLKQTQPQKEKKEKKEFTMKNPETELIEKPLPTPQEELSKPQRMPGIPEEESSGAPAADDYFPNYKVGSRTYLNTLANPSIAYYVELKRKFKLTWNPVSALQSSANEISRGKLDVVVGVSLNKNGELADLIVIRSSGIDNYDKEGLRAIRVSSPFSAPPSQILAEDSMLHMAWTFTVYL